MKVALVFPPQGHFTQPYLSLPSLAAYLRAHDVGQVEMFDESILAYDHFLSKERLQRSLSRIRARERMAELDAKDELLFSDMEQYQVLSEIDLIGASVAESIEEAKRVLRTKELFYDYERYLWAGRTLEQGLRIISTEFAPSRLTAHGFVMRYSVERSSEILAGTADEKENPFIEYFREHTLPRLRALDPDLVGISLTFPSQAIPAFTLARMIKEWKPSVHITVGGGLLAYVAEKLSKRPEVWGVIDSFIMLEGEGPLLALCREIESGRRDLASIPNMIWCGPDGEVRHNTHRDPLDIKTLPTPDFDGMPLEKYFSPELVLPLAITRGCYWGKCVFCTLYTVIGPGYRGRAIDQTVEDMRKLSEKYKTKHFYLAIEDLPPNMAARLPQAILDAGLDVDWWCDARLEHEAFTQEVCDAMAKAGCKRIAFGYESSSRRVLARMCKGIDPDKSIELVRRVRKSGISVTLYVMIGFPTETRDEARETLQTILANRDAIQEVSVRVFYLDESSEIFKRREEFDIVEIYPRRGRGPSGLLRLQVLERHEPPRGARHVSGVHARAALTLPRVPEHEHALPRAQESLLPVPRARGELGEALRRRARTSARRSGGREATASTPRARTTPAALRPRADRPAALLDRLGDTAPPLPVRPHRGRRPRPLRPRAAARATERCDARV